MTVVTIYYYLWRNLDLLEVFNDTPFRLLLLFFFLCSSILVAALSKNSWFIHVIFIAY